MTLERESIGPIVIEEPAYNSGSNPSQYASASGDAALGTLTFIVVGETYKTEESPWPFLCSDLKTVYVAGTSQEEELEKEFQAWDAASDEIHGI